MNLLIAAGVVALLAGVWVIYPLVFGRWGMLGDAIPADVADRESRKRVALAALKDIEYDHAAGKLDDNDYREMRGRLELEALTAVRAATDDSSAAAAPTQHACGFANPVASRFCAGCGERLS